MLLLFAAASAVSAAAPTDPSSAEIALGERLFSETRFAQLFAERSGDDTNSTRRVSDPVLDKLAALVTLGAKPISGPFAGQTMSCRACHLGPDVALGDDRAGLVARTFGDFAERSPLPERTDGQRFTPRNSPSLVDVLAGGQGSLLHFDGEFATAESLVEETFFGRNFGWLPDERAAARRHFARVIREDDGKGPLALRRGGFSYGALLGGLDASIPATLRLPESLRLDVGVASDDAIIAACARVVAAYLGSLRFSRDHAGLHDGSPYDAFLAVNRLPRAPIAGQTPHEYSRRLSEAVAALRAPRFIDDPSRHLQALDQPFRFGEVELNGMKLFFRSAIGDAQKSGAGNCAECHVPPHFTDFAFHNTGVAQEDYDSRHGPGAFAALNLPGLIARNAEREKWLPPTALHPNSTAPSLGAGSTALPPRADLGLWQVYGNPDLPAPQIVLERRLSAGGRLSPDDALAQSVGRFKTSTVRGLGQSAPYFHSGHVRTIKETISFYQRIGEQARQGSLRNPPPEFFGMRLSAADHEALAAFLRSLNEDFRP